MGDTVAELLNGFPLCFPPLYFLYMRFPVGLFVQGRKEYKEAINSLLFEWKYLFWSKNPQSTVRLKIQQACLPCPPEDIYIFLNFIAIRKAPLFARPTSRRFSSVTVASPFSGREQYRFTKISFAIVIAFSVFGNQ